MIKKTDIKCPLQYIKTNTKAQKCLCCLGQRSENHSLKEDNGFGHFFCDKKKIELKSDFKKCYYFKKELYDKVRSDKINEIIK